MACETVPSGQTASSQASTLEMLPTEFLLQIISFLPASSIAFMSLTSKWHHEAFIDQFDPKWRDERAEKVRFLRLLEEELPEMILQYATAAVSCTVGSVATDGNDAAVLTVLDSLPAVILDVYELKAGYADGRTRSLDLLSCGHCATDLRVRVELNCGGMCVHIEVEVWRSFGGRDSDNREETEDAHFCFGEKPFDINLPPARNLKEMFKDGVEEERGVLESPDQSPRRPELAPIVEVVP
ncbi:hypothetical protein LTR99_000058 [Exophiala xenobiotica]|uniref:F-box domain-containing protein n=1 Tax=Vermiconidia calcicola TaxID=1690605 RepID=A0AAV9PYQ6_9PEZI|nr:hypothetical protein LTR92_009211 [Exophiala xenobiotica]KAK5530131.1 hypothetical protein LTR25_009377 [Vermiconidia calcicola]KAK5547451.1 hypothetical protein LTR23_002673 [Chaetothyriales sp. CCFEE 6169]KAK5225114.1 hypothetical protein LTR47_009717 [Exophiala xenobiotica]KAK5231632.1 hypothetical protein LTR72_000816 [Exophiala xenobiotica]